jgi:hypothetical protein
LLSLPTQHTRLLTYGPDSDCAKAVAKERIICQIAKCFGVFLAVGAGVFCVDAGGGVWKMFVWVLDLIKMDVDVF